MTWLWMYTNWIQDQDEKQEFAKNYSILTGSFSNPQMAQRMMKAETVVSSEEDFDKISKEIRKEAEQTVKTKKRRRKILPPNQK